MKGHYTRECVKQSLLCGKQRDVFLWTREINGQPDVCMRVDTGSSQTIVRRNLLDSNKKEQGTIDIHVADGTSVRCPLFNTEIKVDGRVYNRTVAAMETMPVPVLLGRDLPLEEMIQDHALQHQKKNVKECLAVTMRGQARKIAETDQKEVKGESKDLGSLEVADVNNEKGEMEETENESE